MSRYTKAFKLEVVKKALAGKGGSKRLAAIYGADPSSIRNWIDRYRLYGHKCFNKSYIGYSSSFKASVLHHMKRHKWSFRQTSAHFKIPASSSILQWQKLYNQGGITALEPRPRGRPAMAQRLKPFKPTNKPVEEMTQAELMREVQYRRAETAYLKKLEAVLQARESATKPKPK